MGMNTVIPRSNSFINREEAHKTAKSAIHRARVTDVNIAKGTMSVVLEAISYRDNNVTIPLLGLSSPNTGVNGTANYNNAAWGRFIPQKGDLINTGFDTNGTLYALGYASIYYPGFDTKDKEAESIGGIGWGETSGTDIQPGDWDFKSSRGSVLYLGEKAKIGSRNCSTTFNFFTGDIVTESPLLIRNAGPSTQRFGSVRRKLLPTDADESFIPSTRLATTAQEFTTMVKWESLPDGLDLAVFSMGDVIEEVGGIPIIKISPVGLTTRRYFSSVSEAGIGTTYEESVDSNGNYYVTSLTATQNVWTTALSSWTITNLSTLLTSTATISLNSTGATSVTSGAAISLTSAGATSLTSTGAISLTSAAAITETAALALTQTAGGIMTLTAPQIIIGGPLVEPLVKGSTFTQALEIYLNLAAAAWTALAVDPVTVGSKPATTPASVGAAALASTLSDMLTIITKAG